MKLTNTGKISTRWIIALSIIAIFLLGTAALVTIVTTPGRQVRAEIARIKAAGEPTTMQDLAGPSIPPDENAATIYAKVFAFLPSYSSADKNALNAVLSWYHPASPKDVAKAKAVFVKYSSLIPMVKQAVVQPSCQFSVRWQYGTTPTHHNGLRGLSCLLCAGASLAARDGKPDETARLLDLALKISSSNKDEPTSEAFGARMTVLTMTVITLRDVMDRISFTDAGAVQLANTLQTIDLSQCLANSLKGERAMQIWILDPQHRNSVSPGNPTKTNLLTSILTDYYENYWLQKMRDYITYANEPYRDLRKHNPSVLTGLNQPKFDIKSTVILPMYSTDLYIRDSTEAELRGCRIALALHIYHNRYSSYPASLNELKAKLAMPIPTDPFSGKPFIYKQKPQGYLLYSIGANLRDDGGVAPLMNKDQTMTGDIVWKVK